jgi:hypothetical protein
VSTRDHPPLRSASQPCSEVPRNCICLDTAVFERQMFAHGLRGPMVDPSGKPRPKGTTLSLAKVIQSFGYSVPCTLHNAGNDAFMCLWALQMLLDGHTNVKAPVPRLNVVVATPFFPPSSASRSHTMPSGRSRPDSLLATNRPRALRHSSTPETNDFGTLMSPKRKSPGASGEDLEEKMKLVQI